MARYTASMPLLPSALPPKGEARRYVANDFLNLIALLCGACPYSQGRIFYVLDIFIVLLGGFVVVEGEAFARPAQEEPQTAEENEKLQHTVNDGVGLSVLRDPLRRETVGAAVDPFRVERREGERQREEEEEQHE